MKECCFQAPPASMEPLLIYKVPSLGGEVNKENLAGAKPLRDSNLTLVALMLRKYIT
jgi:hypothetical protein